MSKIDQPTYLALGDSYTVGEGVSKKDTWPVILAQRLKWVTPKVIATTGWTTTDLISKLDSLSLAQDYEFISLLIGVNNQYQSIHFDRFKKDLDKLSNLINRLVKENDNVLFLSIPDYSVTPFAKESDTEKISAEIEQYNTYKRRFALERGYQFVNITRISILNNSNDMVSDDDLHPSPKQYKLWVEKILESCSFSG